MDHTKTVQHLNIGVNFILIIKHLLTDKLPNAHAIAVPTIPPPDMTMSAFSLLFECIFLEAKELTILEVKLHNLQCFKILHAISDLERASVKKLELSPFPFARSCPYFFFI